jgi:hypothetical protein
MTGLAFSGSGSLNETNATNVQSSRPTLVFANLRRQIHIAKAPERAGLDTGLCEIGVSKNDS